MNRNAQINHALKLMDNDPQLAADFDKVRSSQFPNKTRREAAELALIALEAKQHAALAAERSKALKHLATTAVSKLKSFVTMGRPDKRQGDLPLDQWHVQHVMQAAERGDTAAIAELQRRGYELKSNTNSNKTTFTKRPK